MDRLALWLTPIRRRALLHGLAVASSGLTLWFLSERLHELAIDAYAYWSVDLADLYAGRYFELGFFPYSPAAALAAAPLGLLPWQAFIVGWWALLFGALAYLGGRHFLHLLVLLPVAFEIWLGNIGVLIAVAIVVGFRWPAAWAFVLFTKMTPGVGLLWFAVRREWRMLALALAATALLGIASLVILPAQWVDWLVFVTGRQEQLDRPELVPRIALAAVLVAWGAATDRKWTVVVAATLAMPRLALADLSVLVGLWGLRRIRGDGHEGRRDSR